MRYSGNVLEREMSDGERKAMRRRSQVDSLPFLRADYVPARSRCCRVELLAPSPFPLPHYRKKIKAQRGGGSLRIGQTASDRGDDLNSLQRGFRVKETDSSN